jgi:hypothetical protein
VSYKDDASSAAAAAASKREKVANPRESFMVYKEWNLTEKRNVGG